MKILARSNTEFKTNGIHTYRLIGDDFNAYYQGKLIARERSGIVEWISIKKKNKRNNN